MPSFEEAFDELYRLAYRCAYRILGDRNDAEDSAQEALARASLRWSRVEDHSAAWVARVTANLAIDLIRHRRRRPSLDVARHADDVSSAASARADIQRALLDLPRRQREVLVLRFVADLTERDVAALMGCSVGTVKQHAARALAHLRTESYESDV